MNTFTINTINNYNMLVRDCAVIRLCSCSLRQVREKPSCTVLRSYGVQILPYYHTTIQDLSYLILSFSTSHVGAHMDVLTYLKAR